MYTLLAGRPVPNYSIVNFESMLPKRPRSEYVKYRLKSKDSANDDLASPSPKVTAFASPAAPNEVALRRGFSAAANQTTDNGPLAPEVLFQCRFHRWPTRQALGLYTPTQVSESY